MKAVIRNDGETVTESMGIDGINWNTGAPLTNPDWCGGPYRLVADYVEISEQVSIDYTVENTAATETVEKPSDETITLTADDIALLRKVIG